MSKECCVLKLDSGEEIISRVVELPSDKIALDHPMVIQVIMQQGTPGFGMMPWLMASEDTEFIIDSNRVVTTGKPKKDIESQYLSAATGLAL
jgi:hypothetical protein